MNFKIIQTQLLPMFYDFVKKHWFLCLSGLLVFIYKGFFDTNDDPYMESSLNGTYIFDFGSPYLMYANSILGYALYWLYSLMPDVSWFFWLLKIPVVLLIAQNNSFLHKISNSLFRNPVFGYLTISLFVIMLTVYYLSFLQFTIASFVLIFTGTVAFFKRKYFFCIVSFILAILLRGYTSVIAVAVIFPVLLWYFSDGKKFVVLLKETTIFGICYLLFMFGLNTADKTIEKQYNPGFKNAVFSRGIILDYHFYEHVDTSVLETIKNDFGWSNNDFSMMSLWFSDHPKFSNENTVSIADLLIRNYSPNLWFYKPGGWIWMAGNWLNPVALIVLVLMLTLLYHGIVSGRTWKKTLLTILPFVFANFILIFVSNFTKNAPFRLYFGIQVFLMFYYLYLYFSACLSDENRSRVYKWIFSIVILVFSFMTMQTVNAKYNNRNKLVSDLHQIRGKVGVEDKIILPIGTHVYFRHFQPGDFRKCIQGFRFVEGKNFALASSLSTRKSIECMDLHLCSVDSDEFIYFCPAGVYDFVNEIYPVFFMENYGLDIELQTLFSGNKIIVFRVRTAGKKLTG